MYILYICMSDIGYHRWGMLSHLRVNVLDIMIRKLLFAKQIDEDYISRAFFYLINKTKKSRMIWILYVWHMNICEDIWNSEQKKNSEGFYSQRPFFILLYSPSLLSIFQDVWISDNLISQNSPLPHQNMVHLHLRTFEWFSYTNQFHLVRSSHVREFGNAKQVRRPIGGSLSYFNGDLW